MTASPVVLISDYSLSNPWTFMIRQPIGSRVVQRRRSVDTPTLAVNLSERRRRVEFGKSAAPLAVYRRRPPQFWPLLP